jgi:hypothetical protein
LSTEQASSINTPRPLEQMSAIQAELEKKKTKINETEGNRAA